MHIKRTNKWVVCFLFIFLIIAACSDVDDPQPLTKQPVNDALQSDKPDLAELDNVVAKFLDHQQAAPFKMWAIVDDEVIATMKGTTKEHQWTLQGQHKEQSHIQLSGRDNVVKWETKKATGELEQSLYGLYSPHEHLKQLKDNYNNVTLIPGSRFEQQWTKVQFNLTDEKMKDAVKTRLGEQFVTPAMLKNIVQTMDVRYTLWYNKQNLDLHQVQMELLKIDGSTPRHLQSIIFLFEEPTH